MPRPRLGRVTVTRSGRAFCPRAFSHRLRSPAGRLLPRLHSVRGSLRQSSTWLVRHSARGFLRPPFRGARFVQHCNPRHTHRVARHSGTGVPLCTVDLTTSSHQHRRVFEVWVILRAVSGDVADAAARVRPPPLTTHSFPPPALFGPHVSTRQKNCIKCSQAQSRSHLEWCRTRTARGWSLFATCLENPESTDDPTDTEFSSLQLAPQCE